MSDPKSVERELRPICESSVELGLMLEGPEPPLGLAQSEVEMIVGRPLGVNRDRKWEADVVPGFVGMSSYVHHDHLVYRRDDGLVLDYRYEGDLAYALALEDHPDV